MFLNPKGGSNHAAQPGVARIADESGRKVQAVCVVSSCVAAPITASTAQRSCALAGLPMLASRLQGRRSIGANVTVHSLRNWERRSDG